VQRVRTGLGRHVEEHHHRIGLRAAAGAVTQLEAHPRRAAARRRQRLDHDVGIVVLDGEVAGERQRARRRRRRRFRHLLRRRFGAWLDLRRRARSGQAFHHRRLGPARGGEHRDDDQGSESLG
jgi:hypothetical protein